MSSAGQGTHPGHEGAEGLEERQQGAAGEGGTAAPGLLTCGSTVALVADLAQAVEALVDAVQLRLELAVPVV